MTKTWMNMCIVISRFIFVAGILPPERSLRAETVSGQQSKTPAAKSSSSSIFSSLTYI